MGIDEVIRGSIQPIVIAHRGASFYNRENTMNAFEAAVNMRAEMVEFDVRRTSDGVLVTYHDPNIGDSLISEMTFEEVKAASAKQHYDIPTLPEVLRYLRGKLPLDIELKEAGYEEQVLQTVLDSLDPDQFVVSSSNDIVILKVRTIRPEIRTGLVLSSQSLPGLLRELFSAARARATGADVLMVHRQLIQMGFLRVNAKLKVPVWVYTINDRKELWKYITDRRIGAVFTDRPDVALFLRDMYAVSQKSASKIRNRE